MDGDGSTSDAMGDIVARLLGRLDRVVARPGGWSARCPAHQDDDPSLSISTADDGSAITHCFAGCSRAAIVAALNLAEGNLHPPSRARPRQPRASTARIPDTTTGGNPGLTGPSLGGLSLETLAAAKRLPLDFLQSLGCTTDRGPSVRIPYHDADGNLAAVRTRLALTGDRFRWRKGDRPLPYGMWRLADARAAGWLLLVEGETDCWTLWHQGVPALGIPGKSTWRKEWASLVAGLDVVLWQEPDAEDLVERVARDLPDLRVIVAPPGTKDVSDAHVRGDDVAALVDCVRAEAPPVSELLDRRAQERLLEAHRAALSVLAHPDPLELVGAEIRAQGYGGDVRAPMLGYLAVTSRVLAPRRGSMTAHTLFRGPSSGGKNAALQAGLRLLPEDAVYVIYAGSPRVLIYDDPPLQHRVVVFAEADSLPAGEDNPAASAVRNLLQDGRLHYKVTVRDPATGTFNVREVDKPGPSVLMTTSIRSLGAQLMTRLFTVEVPDEPAQVRAALAAQAAMELDDPPPPNAALIAFQAYLGATAPLDVVVPFARELATHLGRHTHGPRVLRDFPRLLSLIKATAVIRIAHRVRDAHGRLMATLDDYAAIYRLVADVYEASAGASGRVRAAVGAVGDLTAAKGMGSSVTVSEVAAALEVSIPSTWRRVRDALTGGWLVNDETRKGQTAKLRLGEPLPAISALPSPEELTELLADVGVKTPEPPPTHDGESVFTFSPFTDGYTAPPSTSATDEGGEAGGIYSSVRRENVKTPHDPRSGDGFSPKPDPDDWVDVEPPQPQPQREAPTLWDLP